MQHTEKKGKYVWIEISLSFVFIRSIPWTLGVKYLSHYGNDCHSTLTTPSKPIIIRRSEVKMDKKERDTKKESER